MIKNLCCKVTNNISNSKNKVGENCNSPELHTLSKVMNKKSNFTTTPVI